MGEHQFKGRLEDLRLVTGRGTFTSDRNLPNQLHAAFLRSDRPHAIIGRIDLAAAKQCPGVRAILTGEDIAAAGIKSLPTQLAVNGRDGQPLIKPHRPALAQGKVRYVGEPVALVCAETAAQAQDALDAIVVDYEDLPAVTRAVDALKAGAPQLHDNVPGNRVIDFGQGDEAATEALFKQAAKVVKLSIYNNRVVASPMEPRAVIGSYDAAADRYTYYCVTQGVNNSRGQLCATMGIPEEKMDVVALDVGGGFGVRGNIYPEYPAIVLAAKKTGRPVKWTSSRSEAFLSDEQGRDVVSTGELALDANGRFLSFRFNFVSNLGAYCAPAGPFINSRVTACMTGVYNVPVACSRNQFMVTNTAPMAAYRGAGRPIMSALIERLVTRAAREIGIDEAELRRRNMIPRTGFPFKLTNGIVYDCGDPIGVLDDAVKAARWNDKSALDERRAAARARGRLYGRGMATPIESTGAGNVDDHVEAEFGADGTLTLYTVSHSSGQGHATTFAQIVADVLGMPMESIRLVEGDARHRLVGNGTGGSRSTHGAGSVLQLAAHAIVKKGLPLAARELEAAEGDIEFKDGGYAIKGTDRRVSLPALAKKHPGALDAKSNAKIGATFPNGCHIAEVEIDPDTGMVELVSYLACDDAGTIITHELVEGQMHGGLAQGIGQALREQAVYDDAGQLLTGSYMDYAMPRAGFLRGITLIDHPVPTATNPLGAKGVGEAGVTGSLPTVMNAVLDALSPVGVTHLDMPATPARVWAAIQAAKAGHGAALAVAQ